MNVPKRSARSRPPRPAGPSGKSSALSSGTLALLYELLCSVQSPLVGQPGFADFATRLPAITKAKAELEQAIAASGGPG